MKHKREPYALPDKDCERLRRTEMIAVRMLLAALSVSLYAQKDLEGRLECIPSGANRMRLAVGGLSSVVNDLIGTITVSQAKQLRNTMADFEMRLVPKLTPGSVNLVMTAEEAKELIDMAREKCHYCTLSGDEARKCRLCQLLEATTPLDSYGDGLMCPYAFVDWEDK